MLVLKITMESIYLKSKFLTHNLSKRNFFFIFLLQFCLVASFLKLNAETKEQKIIELITTREAELNNKLADLEVMYKEGLVTLHEAEPLKQDLRELDQFLFLIKNPIQGSYQQALQEKLDRQIDRLGKEIKQKKALWEEGLVATKEVEALEEKVALYNYLLEYISDKSHFPSFLLSKGSLDVIAILGKNYPIESRFGFRNDPFKPSFKQFHAGIDFAAYAGTPIRAPLNAIVSKVVNSTSSGGGKQIRLKHSQDLETVYMHLSQIIVKQGVSVNAGDIIGFVGSTGTRTTGPHLHLEVHIKGVPIDPAKFLMSNAPVKAPINKPIKKKSKKKK